MEIRRSRPDDATRISELEGEIFSAPWQKKDIFSYICSEDGMCFTALDGDLPIAYVIGRLIAPEGEIYRIAVDEKYRGRGIGYRLLSYALKSDRGRGLETVFLEVRSKNAAAIALYSSYGFRKMGVRRGYYKNPDDDAIVMIYGKLGE